VGRKYPYVEGASNVTSGLGFKSCPAIDMFAFGLIVYAMVHASSPYAAIKAMPDEEQLSLVRALSVSQSLVDRVERPKAIAFTAMMRGVHLVPDGGFGYTKPDGTRAKVEFFPANTGQRDRDAILRHVAHKCMAYEQADRMTALQAVAALNKGIQNLEGGHEWGVDPNAAALAEVEDDAVP
jgi:hypothetical protein